MSDSEQESKPNNTGSSLRCPGCKFDCSQVSPVNTKILCPRCGELVIFYGLGWSKSLENELKGKSGYPPHFNTRAAKNIALQLIIFAFILFMFGNFKTARKFLIITPILFVIRGLFVGKIERYRYWKREIKPYVQKK